MIVRVITVLTASLFLAAACTNNDDSDANGNGTGTPGASVCEEAETVEQSVTELVQLDVVAVGTDGLDAAVDQVKTDVESLAAVVGTDVADEATALTNAIEQADETFSTLDDSSLLAATADVALAIAVVATAADDLATALSFECG